jgi:DNA polymerase III alpha subunit
MKEFVHLHLHTEYSFLDSTIKLEPLFSQAKAYGMRACAVTDHGSLFGAPDFSAVAHDHGIKPIIGCEFFIAAESRFDKNARAELDGYHVVLLAMNSAGYRNLIKLSTLAHLEGFFYVPRIDKAILEKHSKGLICLTGCLKGEIPARAVSGNKSQLKQAIEWYLSVFGKRLYFELQDHALPQQAAVNVELIAQSRHYNIPVVATNNCHYLHPEHEAALKVLHNVKGGKGLKKLGGDVPCAQGRYFKSPAEMEAVFSGYPEALTNTLAIAEMCNVSISQEGLHWYGVPGRDAIEGGRVTHISTWTNRREQFNMAGIPGFRHFRTRTAVRETAKALGLPRANAESVLSRVAPGSLDRALANDSGLQEMYRTDPVIRALVDSSMIVKDLPICPVVLPHLFVSSDKPLEQLIPMWRGPTGERVSQYPLPGRPIRAAKSDGEPSGSNR